MTEYWLQRRTLGGWSMITWYDETEKDKAERSFKTLVETRKGYAYRVVTVETLCEHLLDDMTPVDKPEIEEDVKSKPDIIIPKSEWGKSEGWGSIVNASVKPDDFWGNNPSGDRTESSHGMIGKVWLGNPVTKEKKRVDPSEVDAMMANGWIKAGPRTVL